LINYEAEHARINVNNTSADEQARRIAQNPLLTLTMVWRFSRDLTEIYDKLMTQRNISEGL